MGFETMRTQMDSSKDEHLQIKISSGNESSPNKRSRAQLNCRGLKLAQSRWDGNCCSRDNDFNKKHRDDSTMAHYGS
ncbi:hypothetical protein WN944_005133 [Citrus x changshan-huyou]|uniref:Uncharacterized protein n=1 Tax=Citrus x changshan-huyou TaxID=2935761 RepID=A0AAP0M2S3_9ROSI